MDYKELQKSLARFPEALKPTYTMDSPNEPIILFEGDMQLTLDTDQTDLSSGKIV